MLKIRCNYFTHTQELISYKITHATADSCLIQSHLSWLGALYVFEHSLSLSKLTRAHRFYRFDKACASVVEFTCTLVHFSHSLQSLSLLPLAFVLVWEWMLVFVSSHSWDALLSLSASILCGVTNRDWERTDIWFLRYLFGSAVCVSLHCWESCWLWLRVWMLQDCLHFCVSYFVAFSLSSEVDRFDCNECLAYTVDPWICLSDCLLCVQCTHSLCAYWALKVWAFVHSLNTLSVLDFFLPLSFLDNSGKVWLIRTSYIFQPDTTLQLLVLWVVCVQQALPLFTVFVCIDLSSEIFHSQTCLSLRHFILTCAWALNMLCLLFAYTRGQATGLHSCSTTFGQYTHLLCLRVSHSFS